MVAGGATFPRLRCAYEFVRELKLAVTHADTHVSERGRVGLGCVSKAHAPTTRPTQKQQHASHSGYLSARLLSYRSVPSFLSLAASVRSDVSRSCSVLAMVDISAASRSPLVVPSWACRLSVSSMTMRSMPLGGTHHTAATWSNPRCGSICRPDSRRIVHSKRATAHGAWPARVRGPLSLLHTIVWPDSIPMHG